MSIIDVRLCNEANRTIETDLDYRSLTVERIISNYQKEIGDFPVAKGFCRLGLWFLTTPRAAKQATTPKYPWSNENAWTRSAGIPVGTTEIIGKTARTAAFDGVAPNQEPTMHVDIEPVFSGADRHESMPYFLARFGASIVPLQQGDPQ